jgi:hypothetical protein
VMFGPSARFATFFVTFFVVFFRGVAMLAE